MLQVRLGVNRQKWNTNKEFPQLQEVTLCPTRKLKYWDTPKIDRRRKRRVI